MDKNLLIIYMGTPDFAVPSLDILVRNGYQVVAVLTAPDKPAGRGLQVLESPVKKYAVEHQIPILQPLRLKDPDFLEVLRSYNADLGIVVAFRMLPELVWNMPPLGTFNLHGSLLPDYRGAAPINRAIMNGEEVTGLTTFFLKHEIDTGDIVYQEKIEIGEDETAGELHDRMAILGAELVLKTVQAVEKRNIQAMPQPEVAEPKHAPKIFKEDCRINWHAAADEIHNFIRGLSPYPTAWTKLDDKVFKIFRTSKEYHSPAPEPGTIITDGKKTLKIAVNDGFIHLLEIQMEGKKRLKTEEFLRGYSPKNIKLS